MHRLRTRLLVTLVVASIGCGASFVAPAGGADSNGCEGRIETPHYSTGARGVIAKARWLCSRAAIVDIDFRLWACRLKYPQNDVTWLANNCVLVGRNTNAVVVHSENLNTWITRYAPPAGEPGSNWHGYYVACAGWSSDGTTNMMYSGVYWYAGGALGVE